MRHVKASLVATVAFGIASLALSQAIASPSEAKIASLTFKPSADTYTNAIHSSATYGDSDYLVINSQTDRQSVSYVTFEIVGLAPGAQVSSAKLTLTRANHRLPDGSIELRSVAAADWTEASLNADNAPQFGSIIDSVYTSHKDNTVTFDLCDAIKGNGRYSFALTSAVADDSVIFQSRSTGKAPELDLSLRH